MNELEKNLRNYAAEEDEYNLGTSTTGTAEEFCDYLDAEQAAMFHQMAEIAEQKKKWLKLFEQMQNSIKAREFDDAYTTFEDLVQELF